MSISDLQCNLLEYLKFELDGGLDSWTSTAKVSEVSQTCLARLVAFHNPLHNKLQPQRFPECVAFRHGQKTLFLVPDQLSDSPGGTRTAKSFLTTPTPEKLLFWG